MTTTWNDVSARLGRNDLPAALTYAWAERRLTDPVEIARGVRDAWTMAEWPTNCLDIDIWLSLFGAALPKDSYLNEGVVAPRSELPETLTLHRGAVRGREEGMSWTEDEDRAKWFANRFGNHFGEPVVMTLDIPREYILARFHEGRGEGEWVVDPAYFDDYPQRGW